MAMDGRQDTAHAFTLSSPKPLVLAKFFPPGPILTPAIIAATAKKIKENCAIGQRSSVRSTRNRADRLWQEADRLDKCGRLWKMEQCASCKTDYHAPVSCNSRLCPRCNHRYAKKYQKALAAALMPLFTKKTRGKALMLVTLTVTSHRFGDQLPDRQAFDRFHRETNEFFRMHYGKWQVKRSKNGHLVYDATRYEWTRDNQGQRVKERRTPVMKTTKSGKEVAEWRKWKGSGAIITSELGTQSDRIGYLNNNLHCHALVYGDFVPIKGLVESWKKITEDSHGVHVTQVHSLKAAVGYVLKYITKPPQLTNPAGLAEWAAMIKGVRRLRSTGIFVGAIKKEQSDTIMSHHCPKCGGYLCDCGEKIIEDIDGAPSLSLYKELRKAVQLPPPDQPDQRANSTDRMIDEKESAWRAEIGLNLHIELTKWQLAVFHAKMNSAVPTFVNTGVIKGMVYPTGTY